MTDEVLACRIESSDKRTFSRLAALQDRTESAELRRLVKLWIRGQLIERPARPAEEKGGTHG